MGYDTIIHLSGPFSDKRAILSGEMPDVTAKKRQNFLRDFSQNLEHFQLHFQELLVDFQQARLVELLDRTNIDLQVLRQGRYDNRFHFEPRFTN